MNAGDIIMISLREFGDDKGDVVHKYYPEEAFELQELGELPANVTINEGMPDENEDGEDLDLDIGADQNSDGDEDNKNDDLDIDDI